MRLNTTQNRQTAEEIKDFGDWILKIGDGEMDLMKMVKAWLKF